MIVPIILFALILFILLIWVLPKFQIKRYKVDEIRQSELIDLENKLRQTISQVFVGGLLIVGIYFTYTQNYNSKFKQDAKVLSNILKQLNDSVSATRIGAIYILAELANNTKEHKNLITDLLVNHLTQSSKDSTTNHRNDYQLILQLIGEGKLTKSNFDINSASWEKSRINIYNARFSKINLRELNFSAVNFHNCTFDTCQLFGSKFNNSKLDSCKFLNCLMARTEFKNADILKGTFKSSVLFLADFSDAYLRGAYFYDCNLMGTVFKNAEFGSLELDDDLRTPSTKGNPLVRAPKTTFEKSWFDKVPNDTSNIIFIDDY